MGVRLGIKNEHILSTNKYQLKNYRRELNVTQG